MNRRREKFLLKYLPLKLHLEWWFAVEYRDYIVIPYSAKCRRSGRTLC